MTISAELIERYTTEVDVDWRYAFVLSHPTATTKYLIDGSEEYEGYYNGYLHLFQPVPVQIVLPSRDDSGRQDMGLVWCGIESEARSFLDQAIADPTSRISCFFSAFIMGSTTPQIDPWEEFTLSNIMVDKDSVTAVATRADILNRTFPTEVYRVDRWPGLRRR